MWGSVLTRSWPRSQPVSIWREKYEDARAARPLGAKRRGPKFEKSSYRRSDQHCVSWRIRVSQAKRGGKGVPGRGNHTQEGSKVREDQGTLCSFVTPNRCRGWGESWRGSHEAGARLIRKGLHCQELGAGTSPTARIRGQSGDCCRGAGKQGCADQDDVAWSRLGGSETP